MLLARYKYCQIAYLGMLAPFCGRFPAGAMIRYSESTIGTHPNPTADALQCGLYSGDEVLLFDCYNRTFSVERDTARDSPSMK